MLLTFLDFQAKYVEYILTTTCDLTEKLCPKYKPSNVLCRSILVMSRYLLAKCASGENELIHCISVIIKY